MAWVLQAADRVRHSERVETVRLQGNVDRGRGVLVRVIPMNVLKALLRSTAVGLLVAVVGRQTFGADFAMFSAAVGGGVIYSGADVVFSWLFAPLVRPAYSRGDDSKGGVHRSSGATLA
jgi:hypothetical protein